MLPEVRMARVLDAISSHRVGRLSCVEAGELLGFSGSHFRRLRDASEERGEYGLIYRRRGRVSARAADEAAASCAAAMFHTRYFDLRIRHFHEQIVGMPMASGKPFRRSYTWTKSLLQFRGLTAKVPRRGAQPFYDLWVLKGCVIVEDGMNAFVARNLAFDSVQEPNEFLMTVALHAAPDHLPLQDIEGGEQGGRAVALIIVGHGSGAPLLHRQSWLCAVEGLYLRLLVNTEHYGVGGRIAKATIRVLEYRDGLIALLHGPRKIARFLADGSLDEGEAVRKQAVA